MTVIASDSWEKLGNKLPQGEQLIGRLACPDFSDRLFCGLDAGGRRHLFISLRDDDKAY